MHHDLRMPAAQRATLTDAQRAAWRRLHALLELNATDRADPTFLSRPRPLRPAVPQPQR